MAVYKNKKRVIVAIDTGFDGAKICVNGNLINVPFMITDITNDTENFGLRRIDDNFIRCIKDGRTYLLGDVAKSYLLDDSRRVARQADMESFYTLDRYKMPIFEVALNAFIAYALYQYQEITKENDKLVPFRLDELSSWEIEVGVALPHEYIDTLMPIVEKYLRAPQCVELLVGEMKTGEIKYNIKDTFYNSQIVCALINEAVDDEGKDYEGDSPYDHLPALIIDAGYKTFADMEFARDESITNDLSNLDFAMNNINSRVAEYLTSVTGKHYTSYMVDKLASSRDEVRYINENDVKSINVYDEQQKSIKEISSPLISYLNDKHGKLLDIKMILVAGGTGEAYYPYIKDYCEKERPFLSDHTILAGQHGFMGKECPPVFAIVCGLYKDILMQLNEE